MTTDAASATPPAGVDYPVRYSADYPEGPRNRLTVFFRLILVIPILVLWGALSSGGSGWTSGNGAATAAGTIAGTMAGDRIGARTASAGQAAQRCRTVESSREVIKGYNVVYRFNGRDVTTTLPNNPGNTVKVGFGIINDGAPVSDRDYRRDRTSSNGADYAPSSNNANNNYRY
ncbi:MAG: hypothetical protein WCI61_08995 [Chloroflexota bacterium]